jgi:hypothetical protein
MTTSQNNNNGKVKGEKTIEGCIVSQGTEFFIQPKHGKMVRLNSSEDLTAHVGHRVKAHGTEQKAGSAGNTAGTMGASNSGSTSANTGSTTASTSGSASGSTGANTGSTTAEANAQLPQGERAGNTGTTNSGNSVGSAGGSSTNSSTSGSSNVDRKNVSNKELMVTRVDMVSETCPWSDKNKSNQSNSGTTNPY